MYNGNEQVLHIPENSRLEPQHQMQFNVLRRTLNGFKYCYLTLIILSSIIYSFVYSHMISHIAM